MTALQRLASLVQVQLLVLPLLLVLVLLLVLLLLLLVCFRTKFVSFLFA